jgi:hypothetical protein
MKVFVNRVAAGVDDPGDRDFIADFQRARIGLGKGSVD